MAGGNFADDITIDDKGKIAPSGPIFTRPDETISKVYYWVFQMNQDRTGALAAGATDQFAVDADNTRVWQAPVATHEGRFSAGPAVGMAVAISTVAPEGPPIVYWWTESITLHAKPKAASS